MEPVAETLEELEIYWMAYGPTLMWTVMATLLSLGSAAMAFRRLAGQFQLRRVRQRPAALGRRSGPLPT